jgi:hypothetical protein
MSNPAVANPYQNADVVVNQILPSHPQYIARAKTCFGAIIDPTTFDITSWDGGTPAFNDSKDGIENTDCTVSTTADCSTSNSNACDWLRLRFYIFDTQTAESASCYGGDESDCARVGFGGTPDNSPATPTADDTPSSFGAGTGNFTTNTSAPAYPGLAKMLAEAQKVAQTTPGPQSAATKAFCASLQGGTCALGCESSVEEIWLGHRGVYPNPNSAWPIIQAAGHAHPGDRDPPVGALLFYTAPGDANGHVAVYLGNNMVFSTDVLGSGSVYIASADKIEAGGWNMTYRGWADPYFNGQVGNP